ncbi:MAG: hypothetical protein QOD92_2295 [Acidimicrobiaceae bacterium]|jgi:hypothetical protein
MFGSTRDHVCVPADETELERTGRVVGAAILSSVALGVAVVLLLWPLGSIYDSDCGSLLQHPPSQGTCADRAGTRVVAIVMVAIIAAAFFLFALRSSRRKPYIASGGLLTVAVVAALLLIGAPYAVSTTTSLGRSFNLHCPGRFTEYGGYEHPPPGTAHDCGEEANRRLGVSVVIVGLAAVASFALLRRRRHPDGDQSSSDATSESTSARGAASIDR